MLVSFTSLSGEYIHLNMHKIASYNISLRIIPLYAYIIVHLVRIWFKLFFWWCNVVAMISLVQFILCTYQKFMCTFYLDRSCQGTFHRGWANLHHYQQYLPLILVLEYVSIGFSLSLFIYCHYGSKNEYFFLKYWIPYIFLSLWVVYYFMSSHPCYNFLKYEWKKSKMKVCWYDLNDLKVGVGGRFKCKTNSEWQEKKALLHPEDGIWPITIYSGLKNTVKFYLDTKETG